jgi:hypothetical protein
MDLRGNLLMYLSIWKRFAYLGRAGQQRQSARVQHASASASRLADTAALFESMGDPRLERASRTLHCHWHTEAVGEWECCGSGMKRMTVPLPSGAMFPNAVRMAIEAGIDPSVIR